MQNNIINNNNKKIPNINNFTPNSDQIFPISFYNTTLNIFQCYYYANMFIINFKLKFYFHCCNKKKEKIIHIVLRI